MEENKIVSISLFSGAGGLDVASFLAGVPVASSTDFDSDCVKTLRMNELFENSVIIEGDLHQIESSVFADVLKKRDHDKFIVIGGAPCQPFSKAGYWVGNNTRRGINDPRATLVDEYLRVVCDLHPDGFVFENVESLLHPTNRVIVAYARETGVELMNGEELLHMLEDAGMLNQENAAVTMEEWQLSRSDLRFYVGKDLARWI